MRVYSFTVLLLALFFCAVSAHAQQPAATPAAPPNPDASAQPALMKSLNITLQSEEQKSDPEREMWKQAGADAEELAAHQAARAAEEAFESLTSAQRELIGRGTTPMERVKIALDLTVDQFLRVKQPFITRVGNIDFELSSYCKLLEFARHTVASITENKINKRELRQLCKAYEVHLREQIGTLEELSHALDGTRAEALDPALERARQLRLEVLDRVFGRNILLLPQSSAAEK